MEGLKLLLNAANANKNNEEAKTDDKGKKKVEEKGANRLLRQLKRAVASNYITILASKIDEPLFHLFRKKEIN